MRAIPQPIHRLALALALPWALVAVGHAQSPPPAQVVTTNPRVPPAAGTPCVVHLMDSQPFPEEFGNIDNNFVYMPPQACPPPWAKVVFKADISSSRRTVLDDIGISLAGIRLLHQPAPRYDAPVRWHVERDLTDYSALFTGPHTGSYWASQGEDAFDLLGDTPPLRGSARLLFYPPTAATPAPAVPDAVIHLKEGTPLNLPHNIVRAYADVDNAQSWWYFCVPDRELERHPALFDYFAPDNTFKRSIFPHEAACTGGSFREIPVAVDGIPAGIAPVFPLLPADPNINYLHNPLNQPTPTLQMLGNVPFRVDLTPFAGQLDAAGRHQFSVAGALLLYLDRNRTLVTGGVTMNTLAGSQAAPAYTSTLANQGEGVQGRITTRQARQFEIRGFVNTSSGRIDSTVRQSSTFENVQAFDIRGPHRPFPGQVVNKLYQQAVDLHSKTDQVSRRTRGSTLLANDVVHVNYPLAYYYHMATTVTDEGDGWTIALRNGTVVSTQRWVRDADYYRPGRGHYITRLVEDFSGSRTHAYDFWDPRMSNPSTDSNWQSDATHTFTDNAGSCFQASVGANNGVVTSGTRGRGCPDGTNRVRWFARPDGSPDSLGWWH
ncbi:MAG TPA: hypothetical protein VFH59_11710 [Frateuria sp.]|uniref:hypothetical protein n=1 Tax=Frateuria sp. TaxID=2211372 RepID=UPI002D7E6E2D|nr:hypothetical protein [Frateuria sp.]HET6806096.1 hypothetical protein [Frateuria sp.]